MILFVSRAAEALEKPHNFKTWIILLFLPGKGLVDDASVWFGQPCAGPGFPNFALGLFAGMKRVFKTERGQILIFPGSSTGGWNTQAFFAGAAPPNRVA